MCSTKAAPLFRHGNKVPPQSRYRTCNLPRPFYFFSPSGFAHKMLPFQVRPPPLSQPPSPDVLISSDSYAGQISGLMMDNLPKVGTAHCQAASLWVPYGQKQLFSLLSLAQMCQTGCRLQSAALLALGGGCLRPALAANYSGVAAYGGPVCF